jgi:predicted transcriptional regulator of viral defense system
MCQGFSNQMAIFLCAFRIFILQIITIYVRIRNMNSNSSFQHTGVKQIKASDSASWLLSHGVSSVTTDELAILLGIPKTHVPQRMQTLRKRREIVTPTQGLWIPVPPEYLTWGAPPAIDMIDAIMRHLATEYYVGWLSAAEIHGASHHAPQVFQVAVTRAIRARTIGRARFQYYCRAHIGQVPMIQVESRSGLVNVASKETTLLDIGNDIGIVGGIDNAANLIIELCNDAEADINSIVSISIHYPVTAVRRLGFIMENYTNTSGLEALKDACLARNKALSLLDPQAGFNGVVNSAWDIKINREVSPDV